MVIARLICWLRGHCSFIAHTSAVRSTTWSDSKPTRVYHLCQTKVCTRCWRHVTQPSPQMSVAVFTKRVLRIERIRVRVLVCGIGGPTIAYTTQVSTIADSADGGSRTRKDKVH